MLKEFWRKLKRYKPQDWFEIGLVISALTFVLCIFYLFYDWRKSKGDGWAKKLGKRVKTSLQGF